MVGTDCAVFVDPVPEELAVLPPPPPHAASAVRQRTTIVDNKRSASEPLRNMNCLPMQDIVVNGNQVTPTRLSVHGLAGFGAEWRSLAIERPRRRSRCAAAPSGTAWSGRGGDVRSGPRRHRAPAGAARRWLACAAHVQTSGLDGPKRRAAPQSSLVATTSEGTHSGACAGALPDGSSPTLAPSGQRRVWAGLTCAVDPSFTCDPPIWLALVQLGRPPSVPHPHGHRVPPPLPGEWLLTGVERMLTWQRCRGDSANGGCRASNLSRRMADMGRQRQFATFGRSRSPAILSRSVVATCERLLSPNSDLLDEVGDVRFQSGRRRPHREGQ